MRAIVTGGAGFIGGALARDLRSRGWRVVVVDDFSTGVRGDHGDEVVEQDVSEQFDPGGSIDAVFHQAAVTDPRFPDGETLLRRNLGGFENVLRVACDRGVPLVYASTASLYGNTPAPHREDGPKQILSDYALSKLIADEVASHHWRRRHVVGLRYFNVFGPGEAHKGRAASMILHLYRQIASGERPRLFHAGEHVRDFVHVSECVRANLLALDAPPGVYNVGSGRGTSFNDLVSLIAEVVGVETETEYIANPYGDTYQTRTCADLTRANEALRFSPEVSTEEGVRAYVRWLASGGKGAEALEHRDAARSDADAMGA